MVGVVEGGDEEVEEADGGGEGRGEDEVEAEGFDLEAVGGGDGECTAEEDHGPDFGGHVLVDGFGALAAEFDQFVVGLEGFGLEDFLGFGGGLVRIEVRLERVEPGVAGGGDLAAALAGQASSMTKRV